MVTDNHSTSGLSRRELLTRSAVAGGIIWAAPTVLATAAGATTCPTGSCAVYRAVKLNTEDRILPDESNICSVFQDIGFSGSSPGNGFTCPDTENFVRPTGSSVAATTCAQFQSHVQSITREGDFDVVTLEPGYQFVRAISKKSDCVSSIAPGGCSVAKIRNISSHIELIYCGPS